MDPEGCRECRDLRHHVNQAARELHWLQKDAEKVGDERVGGMLFAEVDMATEESLATRLNIASIPTVAIFDAGRPGRWVAYEGNRTGKGM